MPWISPIELEIFKNLFAAICDEMGAALGRSAFSPNIKERKDFSCALFDARGDLVAQAAHIPVHLGSMPLSVKAALKAFRPRPGDSVILNDPYQGGTHLPDITLVTPIFLEKERAPAFFVANRAHHSDVGGKSPGSMALASCLEDEGVVIPPTLLRQGGKSNQAFLRGFLRRVRNPEARRADLLAQEAANNLGARRLLEMSKQYGTSRLHAAMKSFQNYEARITRLALALIPRGRYHFKDYLEDDGFGTRDIAIVATITVDSKRVVVDFSESSRQVRGPLNATRAITVSCVAYVFRCLVKALSGEDCLSLRSIRIITRRGSVIDARYPAPVAGGNVETSQRIVDVLLGALAKALPRIIPAASQGTMNNIAMGNATFTYYETLGGGTGGGPSGGGESAIHSHMTNTLNTPIEALESELPLRITAYQIRKQGAAVGQNPGGAGLIREYQFLEKTEVSLLCERRERPPYGLHGGESGKLGRNRRSPPASLSKKTSLATKLPGKAELFFEPGEILRIETPGGGAWGKS